MLDLSDNQLDAGEDGGEVLAVLASMKQLRVLYLKGNAVVRSIKNYRKRMIGSSPPPSSPPDLYLYLY